MVGGLFAVLRRAGPERAADICAWLARKIGPRLREQKIGRAQLRAAFPEHDDAWVEATLIAAWDNLGRVVGEYVHLDRIWDYDPARPGVGRIETDAEPALLFAAHLANWELPAVAAQRNGLPSAALYRTPNNKAIARDVLRMRSGVMGELIPAGPAAPVRMMEALDAGLHLGMLVDQRFGRGPKIRFLGRTATANPLLARLARRFDCPIHGARAIRLPGNRFRLELTEAITLPRDARGVVDVEAATQHVNDIVEGWIREYPGQWLWQHRRWRM